MIKPKSLLYTFHVGEPIEYLERALEWKDDNGNYWIDYGSHSEFYILKEEN